MWVLRMFHCIHVGSVLSLPSKADYSTGRINEPIRIPRTMVKELDQHFDQKTFNRFSVDLNLQLIYLFLNWSGYNSYSINLIICIFIKQAKATLLILFKLIIITVRRVSSHISSLLYILVHCQLALPHTVIISFDIIRFQTINL